MTNFLKRSWYILVVIVCLGGVGLLIAMPLINEVSQCKQTLADSEAQYNQMNSEEAVWFYKAFKDDCVSNSKVNRWLDYDLDVIDSRIFEAEQFNSAEMLVSVNNLQGAIQELENYLARYPQGVFSDRAAEMLVEAKADKEFAYQRFYEATDFTEHDLRMLYLDTCQGRKTLSDAHQAILESTLPAKTWYPEVEGLSDSLAANVIAEFKVAACFDEVNPTRIEKCEYSRKGIRNAGVERTLERITSLYKLVLKDVRNGETISEYPELIQSNPPKACPEILVIDDTTSPLPNIIYFGTPDINTEVLVWIEEQMNKLD
jgi:hypothetical protein